MAVREPHPQLDLQELADEPVVAAEPAPELQPEPDPAPKEPRAEPRVVGEAITDVLDARTPLLKRAFQNVWPPETDD